MQRHRGHMRIERVSVHHTGMQPAFRHSVMERQPGLVGT